MADNDKQIMESQQSKLGIMPKSSNGFRTRMA